MRRAIPHTITLLNLLCGCWAVLFALYPWENESPTAWVWSCMFIGVGALCDVFDGWVARVLGVVSDLGRELDSLADLVTFGLAPSALYFRLMVQSNPLSWSNLLVWGGVACFLTLMSAYRLASFNVSSTQHHHFVGLPTPASALLTVGIVLGVMWTSDCELAIFVAQPRVLACIAVVQGVLLVIPVHLLSWKLRRPLSRAYGAACCVWCTGSVALMVGVGWWSIAGVVLLYILVSLPLQQQLKHEG